MAVCAVYGGSFDPPHIGHVLAVSYVLAVGLAERVLVVPVFEHAFHKALSPFSERLRLCQRAFASIPGADVSDLEQFLPRPNYTLHTVQALRAAQPADDLLLLLGADAFADAAKWHRFDELARIAPPLVLGRVGVFEEGAPPPVLPGVSSTEVRSWLSQREDAVARKKLRLTVPRAVLEEIEARGLYRSP